VLKKRIAAIMVGGVALLASSGASVALELRVGSASPPAHPSNNPMYTVFMKKLAEASGGDLTAKHYGLEVANLRGMPAALKSGVLDVGNVLPGYFPADFPNVALAAELAPLGQYGSAMVAATTEYFTSCADCLKEFTSKGLLYITSTATPTYDIITTKKPVRTVADLKGMRLRSPGASFSRWIKAMGAIPAEISFNEEYEALRGGLIDGTIAPPVNLIGNRLVEVTKYYTPMKVGTFHATSSFTVRLATWKKLSVKQRNALVTAALAGVTTFEPKSRELGTKGLDALKKKGGAIIKPSKELVAASEALQAKAIESAIKAGKLRYKVADAEAKVKRYAALIRKWNKIIAPIQNDTAAMSKSIYDQVWSKIDVSKYGN
jgi:TRAP-type C4-dicarboxylate transport system substrate-binding protein